MLPTFWMRSSNDFSMLVAPAAGLLCVAVDSGSAAEQLGLGEGQQVTLQPGGDEPAISTPVTLRPTH